MAKTSRQRQSDYIKPTRHSLVGKKLKGSLVTHKHVNRPYLAHLIADRGGHVLYHVADSHDMIIFNAFHTRESRRFHEDWKEVS